MIGTTVTGTALFLARVAAQVEGAQVRPGESPELCEWIRIPTARGYVGVWDAEELGEHGLVIQAYEFTDPDQQDVSFAGEVAFVHERASADETVAAVLGYLAGPSVRRSR